MRKYNFFPLFQNSFYNFFPLFTQYFYNFFPHFLGDFCNFSQGGGGCGNGGNVLTLQAIFKITDLQGRV